MPNVVEHPQDELGAIGGFDEDIGDVNRDRHEDNVISQPQVDAGGLDHVIDVGISHVPVGADDVTSVVNDPYVDAAAGGAGHIIDVGSSLAPIGSDDVTSGISHPRVDVSAARVDHVIDVAISKPPVGVGVSDDVTSDNIDENNASGAAQPCEVSISIPDELEPDAVTFDALDPAGETDRSRELDDDGDLLAASNDLEVLSQRMSREEIIAKMRSLFQQSSKGSSRSLLEWRPGVCSVKHYPFPFTEKEKI